MFLFLFLSQLWLVAALLYSHSLPLLSVLFAGAYSPHFKPLSEAPLERALEPLALTVLPLSLSLALSAHTVAAFYLPPEPCVSYEPRKATDLNAADADAAAAAAASAACALAVQLAALQMRHTRRMRQTFCCLWSGTSEEREQVWEVDSNSCALCLHWAVS